MQWSSCMRDNGRSNKSKQTIHSNKQPLGPKNRHMKHKTRRQHSFLKRLKQLPSFVL